MTHILDPTHLSINSGWISDTRVLGRRASDSPRGSSWEAMVSITTDLSGVQFNDWLGIEFTIAKTVHERNDSLDEVHLEVLQPGWGRASKRSSGEVERH